jgi:hypothetical protein
MSMDASGTIAGAITFSRWKGRPFVRRHAIPSNPQTALQVAMRSMMKYASQAWTALGDPAKATWEPAAEAAKISPFNQYIKFNLARWRSFLPYTAAYPPGGLSPAPDAATIAVTGGMRYCDIEITEGAAAPDAAWAICRDPGAIGASALSLIIAILPYTSSPVIFTDAPLVAGTYHYMVRGFMVDGVWGADSNDDDGTVT